MLGGKLTDCLNVGIEVVEAVRDCGVTIVGHPAKWFGEPDRTERDRFLLRAGHAGLRRPTQREPAASFADLLWRRYGRRAHEVVARVEADRWSGAPLMSVGDYCRAEIEVVAEEEWIVTMDDFLRRRTRLGQLERPAGPARRSGRRRGQPHPAVRSRRRAVERRAGQTSRRSRIHDPGDAGQQSLIGEQVGDVATLQRGGEGGRLAAADRDAQSVRDAAEVVQGWAARS